MHELAGHMGLRAVGPAVDLGMLAVFGQALAQERVMATTCISETWASDVEHHALPIAHGTVEAFFMMDISRVKCSIATS